MVGQPPSSLPIANGDFRIFPTNTCHSWRIIQVLAKSRNQVEALLVTIPASQHPYPEIPCHNPNWGWLMNFGKPKQYWMNCSTLSDFSPHVRWVSWFFVSRLWVWQSWLLQALQFFFCFGSFLQLSQHNMHNWLVVSNIFFHFIYGMSSFPTDFHIFQDGFSTTNWLVNGC